MKVDSLSTELTCASREFQIDDAETEKAQSMSNIFSSGVVHEPAFVGACDLTDISRNMQPYRHADP